MAEAEQVSQLHISTQVWLVSAAAQDVVCQLSLVANKNFFLGVL